jgi:hypothetical protein
MHLYSKRPNAITEKDLEELKIQEVPEDSQIDYKRELPKKHSDLAPDIVAFANTSGGYLLIGIEEGTGDKKGIPINICGISIKSKDEVRLSLENAMRDSIEPHVSGMEIEFINVDTDKVVIAIRIPQSWARPHLARHRAHARNSAGTYLMDITQLRSMFAVGSSVGDKARRFHLNRFVEIAANNWTINLLEGAGFVIHVIPFKSLDIGFAIDLPDKEGSDWPAWVFDRMYSSDRRLTVDGFCIWEVGNDGAYYGAMLFRNGIYEAIDRLGLFVASEKMKISGNDFETAILKGIKNKIHQLAKLNVEPPFLIFCSGYGLEGCQVIRGESLFARNRPIDRNQIHLPEVLIESLEDDIDKKLEPLIDGFWQAGDHQKSPNRE